MKASYKMYMHERGADRGEGLEQTRKEYLDRDSLGGRQRQ